MKKRITKRFMDLMYFNDSYDFEQNNICCDDDIDYEEYRKLSEIKSIRFSKKMIDQVQYLMEHYGTCKQERVFSTFVIEAVEYYCEEIRLDNSYEK